MTAHTDHPTRHFDRTCPACLEIEACVQEGRDAAAARKSFRDHCPYTFNRAGLTHTHGGHLKFELDWRPRMDAWFRGWKDWLNEHDLGNNFEPIKKVKPSSGDSPR